jgi:hypothetical protein
MNILIKLGIFLAVFLCTLMGFSQSKSNKVYDMFSGKDGVSSISLSKSAIVQFDLFFDDDTKEVVSKIDRFRFMSYDENKGKLRSYQVYERISTEFSSVDYFSIDPSELDCKNCSDKWNNNEVKLWGRGDRVSMSEFHILLTDNNNCLLFSFYGDITIDDINKCADFGNTAQMSTSIKIE